MNKMFTVNLKTIKTTTKISELRIGRNGKKKTFNWLLRWACTQSMASIEGGLQQDYKV
jgi:hypothetical protein